MKRLIEYIAEKNEDICDMRFALLASMENLHVNNCKWSRYYAKHEIKIAVCMLKLGLINLFFGRMLERYYGDPE
jgi:hypothetical protein